MEFLKKHYEKILLSVVLIGLAVAAAFLPIALNKEKADLDNSTAQPTTIPPIKPADISVYNKSAEMLKNPPNIDLTGEHLVFNPATWKQKSNGDLIKMKSANEAELLVLVKTTPLNLVISFDRSTAAGFNFSITKEAAKKNAKPVQRYLKAGGTNEFFKLVQFKGTPEEPTEFTLELAGTKEVVTVAKGQPYKRVDGYAADLKYDLENKVFNDTRIGSNLTFGGETYKVIAINKDEVRVQANSNQKQTTIKLKSVP